MGGGSRGTERLVALFLLGAIAFNPLVMRVFDLGGRATVLGVPTLFLYLFVIWGLLIVLLALVASRARDLDVDEDGQPSEEGPV